MSLDEWMKARNMNSQQFGDQVGLTQSYVSRLRRRTVTPSVVTAVTIRNFTNYEVSIDDLLPRTVVPPEEIKRAAEEEDAHG
jgi:transcriptional regulator with XRE-family HTH domain